MALLTADAAPFDNVRFPSLQAYTLKNSTNFFWNSIVAFNPVSGRMEPFNGTAGQMPLGRLYDADNGSPSGTANPALGVGDDNLSIYAGISGRPQGRVQIDSEVLPAVTITGLSAATQVFAPVYLNSDDHTFTLTPPATGAVAIGCVLDWSSGTTGDLLVFSLALRVILGLCGGVSGGGGYWVQLASIPAGASNILAAAGTAGLAMTAPFHGKITDAFEINHGVALTGGPVTLTPQITPSGGSITPTTGGAMVVPASQAAKTRQSGTAITGANEFHVGDTIDLASTTVTAITAGAVDVWVKLQPLVGA